MEVGKLSVKLRKRAGKGGNRRVRAEGLVPGVCYGVGVEQPLSVVVHPKALKASLDPVKGGNTVITIDVDGGRDGARQLTAMLWEYQTDPIRRTVTHVDFKAIDPEKVIEAEVPIEVSGKAAGVVAGGQITFARHELPVKCKPADIPDKFVVDVTALEIGDVFHASDLEMPAGVSLAIAGEQGLVSCIAPEKEEVSVVPEEGALAEGEQPAEGEKAEGEKKEEGGR